MPGGPWTPTSRVASRCRRSTKSSWARWPRNDFQKAFECLSKAINYEPSESLEKVLKEALSWLAVSRTSECLATFKAWADEHFGGIRSAFAVFDADGSNSVTLREWRHACRIYGFNQGSSSLFKPLSQSILNGDEMSIHLGP